MGTEDQVTAIADLTRQGVKPERLELGAYYVVHTGGGNVERIDLTEDQYLEQPPRIEGTVKLTHFESLLAYWDKHSDRSSEVYADRDGRTITAVIDDNHGANSDEADDGKRARWGRHRAILTYTLSQQMQLWLGNNGKAMSQVQFAEFIEDNLPYIVAPQAADLIEMVQTFQATTTAKFESSFRIQNGQRVLSYVEDVQGRMSDGKVPVPTSLTLRLPIWRGDDTPTEFTARLRFRVPDGRLTFSYHLNQPNEVIDGAFEDQVTAIEDHIQRAVLRGTPAGAR